MTGPRRHSWLGAALAFGVGGCVHTDVDDMAQTAGHSTAYGRPQHCLRPKAAPGVRWGRADVAASAAPIPPAAPSLLACHGASHGTLPGQSLRRPTPPARSGGPGLSVCSGSQSCLFGGTERFFFKKRASQTDASGGMPNGSVPSRPFRCYPRLILALGARRRHAPREKKRDGRSG